MMDETARREMEEAFNRADTQIAEYLKKAKEQGIPQSQVEEQTQAIRAQQLKDIRAAGKKHGLPLERLIGFMEAPPGELLPEVDPLRLIAAWADFDRTSKTAIGLGALRGMPPDDIWPLNYRCLLLKMLESMRSSTGDDHPLLAPLKENGRLTEAAVRAFARFPVKWMGVGQHPLPFDLEAFVEEVRKESGGV